MKREDYFIFSIIILLLISIFFTFTNILKFKLGLDLAGGVVLIYKADLKNVKQEERNDILLSVKDLIERRINYLGVVESSISYSQSGEITVEIPGIKDPEEAKRLIGETPLLEFRIPVEKGTTTEFVPSELTGRFLKTADVEINPNTGFPVVSLELDSKGAKIFENLTREYLNKPIAIYLDGEPISAPIVRDIITNGRAIIEGKFTYQEAQDLARKLKQGALPVSITLIGQSVVNPLLGKQFLDFAIKGGMIGTILVLIFMLFYYRLQGLIADIALIFYIFFNLFLYKLLGITLSLSGITGLILSIGMAVDANILIAERMKEEKKKGLKIEEYTRLAFERAWPSIRDSNFTTILSCMIIYSLTSSFVRGFALTLGMGVLISMLTAVFFTRILTFKITKKFAK
ncbi:MAG: protein translocase subunit SecD [Minisyncoccia bacterium]